MIQKATPANRNKTPWIGYIASLGGFPLSRASLNKLLTSCGGAIAPFATCRVCADIRMSDEGMDMGHDRNEWLRVAAGVSSYRAMYDFAGHIIQSAVATARDRRAARRVHRMLGEVIHLPIADAAHLMRSRQCFAKLVTSLSIGIDEATLTALCCSAD